MGGKSSAKKVRKTALQKQHDERREKIHKDFLKRHKRIAETERGLKKANIAAKRDFKHKLNGTPETHAKAAIVQQGAMARLYQSGAIDAQQLDASVAIATMAERIGAEVRIRTVSLETRVDGGGRHDGTFFERLGAVRAEIAYSAWRKALPQPAPVLAMIVDDIGIAETARFYRMGKPRARALLIEALDLWVTMLEDAYREISAADLAAWHAGIL